MDAVTNSRRGDAALGFDIPAVVTVKSPVVNVSVLLWNCHGPHRYWPIGSFDWPGLGADRNNGASTAVNRVVCLTLGRIRYSHDRSLVPRGAVKADPLSC